MPLFIVGALVCTALIFVWWIVLGRELDRSMEPTPGENANDEPGRDT